MRYRRSRVPNDGTNPGPSEPNARGYANGMINGGGAGGVGANPSAAKAVGGPSVPIGSFAPTSLGPGFNAIKQKPTGNPAYATGSGNPTNTASWMQSNTNDMGASARPRSAAAATTGNTAHSMGLAQQYGANPSANSHIASLSYGLNKSRFPSGTLGANNSGSNTNNYQTSGMGSYNNSNPAPNPYSSTHFPQKTNTIMANSQQQNKPKLFGVNR
jgi:hypothetical protein